MKKIGKKLARALLSGLLYFAPVGLDSRAYADDSRPARVSFTPVSDIKISEKVESVNLECLVNNEECDNKVLTSDQIVERYKSNIITPVLTETGDRSYKYWAASGFIISNDGFFLTNNHVVTARGDKGKLTALYFGPDNQSHSLGAKVIATSKERDLALCKIDGDFSYIKPTRFSEEIPLTGDKVVACYSAYPRKEEVTVSRGWKEGLSVDFSSLQGNLELRIIPTGGRMISLIEGYAGRPGDDKKDSEYGLMGDVQEKGLVQVCPCVIKSNKGNSGSPFFNSKGEVIGILCAGNDNGDVVITPSPTIIDFIRQYNKNK